MTLANSTIICKDYLQGWHYIEGDKRRVEFRAFGPAERMGRMVGNFCMEADAYVENRNLIQLTSCIIREYLKSILKKLRSFSFLKSKSCWRRDYFCIL